MPTFSANQDDANCIVNYHASSDTLDKVDRFALKRHAAYAAVTVAGFANRDARPGPHQSRAQIEAQIKANGFDVPMGGFGQWEDWAAGRRACQPEPTDPQ